MRKTSSFFFIWAGRIVNEYELSYLEELMNSIFLFKFWVPFIQLCFFVLFKLKIGDGMVS